MTQEKWLTSRDPQELLGLLGLPFGLPSWTGVRPPIVTERKVRLFLAACARLYDRSRSQGNQEVGTRYEREADDSTGPVSETGGEVGFMTALYGTRVGGQCQCTLLRCIFGNPFRPSCIDPACLAWHDGTVRRIAEAIYDDHAFGQLPILADALEEAGCTEADVLNHCRQPGEHARGCWVVDLLLGKT
jgi:hypothetical protein